MRKILASLALVAASFGAIHTSPVAEAGDFYCQRGASGGQYGSTCSKFGHASENWYQKVRVVCSDGLGDVAFDGPTRYVYTYPTNNWSFRGGCPLGFQFRYYTYVLWRG